MSDDLHRMIVLTVLLLMRDHREDGAATMRAASVITECHDTDNDLLRTKMIHDATFPNSESKEAECSWSTLDRLYLMQTLQFLFVEPYLHKRMMAKVS